MEPSGLNSELEGLLSGREHFNAQVVQLKAHAALAQRQIIDLDAANTSYMREVFQSQVGF